MLRGGADVAAELTEHDGREAVVLTLTGTTAPGFARRLRCGFVKLGGYAPYLAEITGISEEEGRRVGEEVARSGVRLLDLETSRCRPVGTTSRGTRLEVFEPYLEADLRVCVGNIEYHYFAGFSGGAKAVVPGLCSYAAISDNHSMMLAPTARAGIMEGNPVREDIDEAAEMIGIDFILNVLLDEEKRIWHAVAGHFLAAHRAGAEVCRCAVDRDGDRMPRGDGEGVAIPAGAIARVLSELPAASGPPIIVAS